MTDETSQDASRAAFQSQSTENPSARALLRILEDARVVPPELMPPSTASAPSEDNEAPGVVPPRDDQAVADPAGDGDAEALQPDPNPTPPKEETAPTEASSDGAIIVRPDFEIKDDKQKESKGARKRNRLSYGLCLGCLVVVGIAVTVPTYMFMPSSNARKDGSLGSSRSQGVATPVPTLEPGVEATARPTPGPAPFPTPQPTIGPTPNPVTSQSISLLLLLDFDDYPSEPSWEITDTSGNTVAS